MYVGVQLGGCSYVPSAPHTHTHTHACAQAHTHTLMFLYTHSHNTDVDCSTEPYVCIMLQKQHWASEGKFYTGSFALHNFIQTVMLAFCTWALREHTDMYLYNIYQGWHRFNTSGGAILEIIAYVAPLNPKLIRARLMDPEKVVGLCLQIVKVVGLKPHQPHRLCRPCIYIYI